MQVAKENKKNQKELYTKFDQLNGSHPLKKVTPNGYVDYPARLRKGAKIRFFNFELAKEMGLIPKDHDEQLDDKLSQKIIDTFSIIIINEYDQMNSRYFPKEEIKEGTYMATRYLQLQHKDKKGLSSGDGRSVWNGRIKNRGKVWDISSCGTGATRLSPATTKFNKFFKSGDPSISYGCGYSEIDEGMAQALFSEVFFQNKIKTERTLVLLEYEKGYSINVRAHENLLRPSHFFMYLKQNELGDLKSLVDYYIEVNRSLPDWESCPQTKSKYDFFLKQMAKNFGKIASQFENEYIFCWLDWDGDNILMDGSLIDYGSIRQFGMFHADYRYDDVERMSTSILEQRDKAKYIVQTFAQIVDYIKTGEKKSIGSFRTDKSIEIFDKEFEDEKNRSILYKIGFSGATSEDLIKKDLQMTRDFRKVFSYFERQKSKEGLVKISDGVCWDAIFCMRDMLRELPQILLARKDRLTNEEFISILKSDYAKSEDLEVNSHRSKMIKTFQDLYIKLIEKAAKITKRDFEKQLLEVSMRSSIINKAEKVTGDSVALIVDRLLKQRKKLKTEELYGLIKEFSLLQTNRPESEHKNKEISGEMREFFRIVRENREGI